MIRTILMAVAALAATAVAAQAQDAVTFTLRDVRDASGDVLVTLCGDPAAPIPGRCPGGPSASAPARQGEVTVVVPNVRPGAYSVQIVHDANKNGRLDFPAEGYGFGNDAAFPPTFASASIKVDGPTAARARMMYGMAQTAAPTDPMMAFTAAGWVRMGRRGAPAPAGITKVDVRDDGLYGAFYAPVGKTGLPTLIILGGSEGGLTSSSFSALSFVRQGYAVLALAYFAEVGLPRALVGVRAEYFDKAVAWTKARPEVDPVRIGAMGTSRGSEAVMLMATRNKDIRAVVAVAPSSVFWQGMAPTTAQEAAWTAAGKPVPFATIDFTGYQPGKGTEQMYLPRVKAPGDAAIPVERINGPLLLISGEDDQLWPSGLMAQAIEARLKARGFKHAVRHLSYAGAGHAVFGGDMSGRPPPAANAGAAPTPGGFLLGGTPSGTYAAAVDSWPKVLTFFDDALKPR